MYLSCCIGNHGRQPTILSTLFHRSFELRQRNQGFDADHAPARSREDLRWRMIDEVDIDLFTKTQLGSSELLFTQSHKMRDRLARYDAVCTRPYPDVNLALYLYLLFRIGDQTSYDVPFKIRQILLKPRRSQYRIAFAHDALNLAISLDSPWVLVNVLMVVEEDLDHMPLWPYAETALWRRRQDHRGDDTADILLQRLTGLEKSWSLTRILCLIGYAARDALESGNREVTIVLLDRIQRCQSLLDIQNLFEEIFDEDYETCDERVLTFSPERMENVMEKSNQEVLTLQRPVQENEAEDSLKRPGRTGSWRIRWQMMKSRIRS